MFARTEQWQKSDSDLAHGQVVIIAARWILVAAGLVLALWNPGGVLELQITTVPVLGLAVGNFALHMQVATRGPLLAAVVYAASLVDLAAISMLIVVVDGFPAVPYVFYFPALLAISVTFRSPITALYVAATVGVYGLIAAATATRSDLETVLLQVLMLAAVPVCGNVYWRLERDRRRRVSAQTAARPAPHAVAPDVAGSR